MNPLKIHFYTSFVHEQGTYFRFHNLARGLQALGQDVTVFSCDHDRRTRPRTENRDGIEYDIVPVSPAMRLSDAGTDPVTILKNAARRRPACDIAHLFQPFPTAAFAWSRSVARAHFWDWDDLWTHETGPWKLRPLRRHWPRAVIQRLEQRLPRKADHVTAIDHYLSSLATERHARKVTLLYNPSPTMPLGDRAEVRRRLGLDPQAFYVGFMGFTIAEMEWCLTAVSENAKRFPGLRFAICGPSREQLGTLPAELEGRINALGRLPTQSDARQFASALDLALLPLEDNLFNRSRFPLKFSEYLMAGTPVLCSEIGECALLSRRMPWVLTAGTTREDWLRIFPEAIEKVRGGHVPSVGQKIVADLFADSVVCKGLLDTYRTELNG